MKSGNGQDQEHLGFIGSGKKFDFILRVTEMHWRVLRWGMTRCFSKISQAAIQRKDQGGGGRGVGMEGMESLEGYCNRIGRGNGDLACGKGC